MNTLDPLIWVTLTVPYKTIIIYSVIILVLLVFSSFFSMCETVYSTVQEAKLRSQIEEGNKSARKALWISEHFDRVLSVILIGNNLVNIAMSTLGLRLFLTIFSYTEASWVDIINTVLITLLVLIFGEILPKTRGKAHSNKLALRYASLLYAIVIILTPISYPFYKMNMAVKKNTEEDDTSLLTSDDLGNIIDTMEDEGSIDDQEASMLQKVLDLSEIEVKDIMTPRVDVVAIDVSTPIEEIKKCFFENQYSRVPVYEGTIDHIVGVLFEKNFFKAYIEYKDGLDIRKLMNEPIRVVGSMRADALLALLKSQKVHLAIVLDEYAGFDGVVTLEDVLEELVGEIYDEHDEVQFTFSKITDNHYIVSGDLEVANLFDLLEIKEDSIDSESTTLGGWVQDGLERIPKLDDKITYRVIGEYLYDELSSEEGIEYLNLNFTVIEIVDNRITKLDLIIEKEKDDTD